MPPPAHRPAPNLVARAAKVARAGIAEARLQRAARPPVRRVAGRVRGREREMVLRSARIADAQVHQYYPGHCRGRCRRHQQQRRRRRRHRKSLIVTGR